MNLTLNKLKVNERGRQYFFSLLGIYFFLFFFNINNKTFFLFYCIFSIFIFFLLRDVVLALFLTFFSSQFIPTGKIYFFELIPASLLNPVAVNGAYNVYWFFSVGTFFALLLLYLILRSFRRVLSVAKEHKLINLIFISIIFQIISLCFSKNITLSLLLFLENLIPYIVFFFTIIFRKVREKGVFYLSLTIAAQLVFESSVIILQLLKGGAFGSSIEQNLQKVAFGNGSDEDALFFRPNGTFDHPNTVAAYLAPLIVFLFSLLYLKAKKFRNSQVIFLYSIFLGSVGLIITLSRSAWLSLLAALIFITYLIEKKWRLKLQKNIQLNLAVLSLIALFMFLLFVLPRIKQTTSTFFEGGSLYARKELIDESLKLIMKKPLGVGLGMSVPEMYTNNSNSVIYSFPTPVHNWYLWRATETGVFDIVCFCAFLLLLLRKFISQKIFFKNIDEKLVFLGLAASMIVLLLNGTMQLRPGGLSFFYFSLALISGKIDNF